MDRHDELRDQLLNLVEDRLSKQGYRAMSVDEIARAAGISTKTLYAVFESKEDMAAQVVDRIFARVEEEMAKISTIPDPLERFRKGELAITEIISPIDRNSDVQRPFFRSRLARFAKQRFRYRTDLFREAQEKGLIRSGIRPEIITLAFVATVKALIDPNNRIEYGYSFKKAHEDIVDVFLEGLKPR